MIPNGNPPKHLTYPFTINSNSFQSAESNYRSHHILKSYVINFYSRASKAPGDIIRAIECNFTYNSGKIRSAIALLSSFAIDTECFRTTPRYRRAVSVTLGIVVVVVVAFMLTCYSLVPFILRYKFSKIDGAGEWPITNFNRFTNSSVIFNVSYLMPFTNYVGTTLKFTAPMRFLISEKEVAHLEFPEMNFGWNQKYMLQTDLTLNLVDLKMWESLWTSWIASSSKNASVRSAMPMNLSTQWNLRTMAELTMFGVTWWEIPLETIIRWNGGWC